MEKRRSIKGLHHVSSSLQLSVLNSLVSLSGGADLLHVQVFTAALLGVKGHTGSSSDVCFSDLVRKIRDGEEGLQSDPLVQRRLVERAGHVGGAGASLKRHQLLTEASKRSHNRLSATSVPGQLVLFEAFDLGNTDGLEKIFPVANLQPSVLFSPNSRCGS